MPQKELDRLQAVHRFLNLDIHKDAELQEIVELAAELCDTPMAMITLIDDKTEYFLFKIGTALERDLRKNSFCQYVIDRQALLVIPDALADERFTDNLYVKGYPYIRFYAGAPLITHDGLTLGTICILDTRPKELTVAQQHLLKVLAKRVIQFMEFEFSIEILKEQFLKAKGAEIKLRSFFESSVACHLLLGKDQEVLAYNKNMAQLLQRLHDVTIHTNMKVNEILKKKSLVVFLKDYRKALKGEMTRLEREVAYPNGQVIWWEVTYEPASNDTGEIIGVSYNAIDITERKLHEQRIVAQNESLKQIAHIQSHELRKPVATIIGLVDLFQSEARPVSREDLAMLALVTSELDEKIKKIVHFAD